MPTAIPNVFAGQTPLGAAFSRLAGALASRPNDAQLQAEANAATLGNRKLQGQDSLANLFSKMYAPSVATPTNVPVAGSPTNVPVAASPTAGSPAREAPQGSPSPVAAAFQATAPQAAQQAPANAPDWGALLKAGVYAGMDPKVLGGYNLFGAANDYGATDPRTQNAQVGAGQTYENTYGALDRKQTDAVGNNVRDNQTSTANNAATNATSRANNQANIQKDYGIEGMKEKAVAAQNAASGNMTPEAIDYTADIYRRTGQLPPLGMGRAGAQVREAILNRAQQLDAQDGRTGADAVAAFADYQGQRAGQRTAGTREAQAGMAVNELQNLIPVAKDAFANVARTGFVPADKLLQAYQSGTNDPDLNKAAVAVNDVINAHARAINPNGQVTDAGRAQGYELLNTAKDQAAFNAILDQMAVGAAAALKSPGQTSQQMHAAASAPLAAHGGVQQGAQVPTAEATRVLNGVTYHKINGKWMQE